MVLIIIVALFWVWVLNKIGAPKIYAFGMLAVVGLGIVLAHVSLPLGHPIREATGGSLRPWGIVAVLGAIVYAYAQLLNKIRAKSAADHAKPEPVGPFSRTELDRYARHIVLREVGAQGQKRLKDAKVLVIGAGGLGSPTLQYLAAAGVGVIGVIDDDEVSLSNLQRQVLFNEDLLGQPKVLAAERVIEKLNPHVELRPYNRRLTEEIARDLIEDYDLVLDGTDDFATRQLVNRTCVQLKIPLISGAISQWEGQITLVDSSQGTACMNCLFPKEPAPGTAPSCAEGGVLGALPGVIGSMMAAEAIKWITQTGSSLAGRMIIYDALYAETRIIQTQRRADCEVYASLEE